MSQLIESLVPHPRAGAAAVDISPRTPVFLYGYPHSRRISTGIHDSLMASALYLEQGTERCLLISVDVIWLSKRLVSAARALIASRTGIAPERILIAASHTHSGPSMVAMLSNEGDEEVHPPDSTIVDLVIDGIVAAAVKAVQNAEAAEIGFADAKVVGIGGNRYDPRGPSSSNVPVMAIRSIGTRQLLAVQYVFSVHPTVLHEDSTVISGDFPGITRGELQERLAAGKLMPVLNHLGAAGNQSPRYAIISNTISEATRLGVLLADAIVGAIDRTEFASDWTVEVRHNSINLPLRALPSFNDAERLLQLAKNALESLRRSGADRPTLRTAECNLFGAEELVTLAAAVSTGRMDFIASKCLPAEIQAIRIGLRQFIAWPGEIFIEFALELQRTFPKAVLISLANGELQGYLVTAEAAARGGYETSNAIFASPDSADVLTIATHALLNGVWQSNTERHALPVHSGSDNR